MPYTEAQKKATLKYLAEKTDDIRLRVPKGTKERWKHYANLAGKSMTVYVCDAVARQIAIDEDGENIPENTIDIIISLLKDRGFNDSDIVEFLKAL